MTLSTNGVLENVEILAHRLTSERRSGARGTVGRRLRRGRGDRLPPAAGSGVDGRAVGIHARSTRAVAHAISLIAAGDSSLALILSMEPVAMFVTGWLADFHADEADPTWLRQREEFVGLLASGADAWGGLLSERDGVIRSSAKQSPDGDWSISGEKSSGSGWDHVAFMLTNAVPEGEDRPDLFVLDLRDRQNLPGVSVSRTWDGHGMTASGSHAVALNGAHVREWPGPDARTCSTACRPARPSAAVLRRSSASYGPPWPPPSNACEPGAGRGPAWSRWNGRRQRAGWSTRPSRESSVPRRTTAGARYEGRVTSDLWQTLA